MLNLKLPSTLIKYVDTFRSTKCRAWYIVQCVRYVYEHNINIYEYYEGIENGNGIKKSNKKGESSC